MPDRLTPEVAKALAADFADGEVEFKPQVISVNRALAVPFINARTVMRRLDSAAGPGSWEFDWEPIASPDNRVAVKGRLNVLGLTRCDVGEASREEEPLKSAVSDALKRCAVHFGVGRSLYDTPPQWYGWDQGQRRWTEQPRLPMPAQSSPVRTTAAGAVVRAATGEVVTEAPVPDVHYLRSVLQKLWLDNGGHGHDFNAMRERWGAVVGRSIDKLNSLTVEECQRLIETPDRWAPGEAASA